MRVLVVGAGIAGLATARALGRAGLATEVVDRAPGPDPSGAGLYLPGNATRALARLGLRLDPGPAHAEPAHARPIDARPTDAEPADARSADAGPAPAGPADAGPTHAEPADARSADAGPTHAGPTDARPIHAGPADAGPAPAGTADAGSAGAALIAVQRVLDHRGRVLFEVDLPAFWDPCGPCVALPRPALHRALSDGVPVRYGLEPIGLDAAPDAVEVRLSDGSRREVDLVVGADGIRSGVRALLGDTRPPRRTGQLSWRFLVDLPGVDAWTALLGPGTSFLLVPVGDGRVYCYADADTADRAAADRLRELFGGFADPVPAALDRLGDPRDAYVGWIEEAVPPEPTPGRVVLVGDAAHATAPNMAQGAAMAAEDALVLAEELGAADSVPAAVAAFTERRADRTAWVRTRARRRDHTRRLPAAVRNTALRLAGERIYRADYRPLLAEP